MRFDVPGAEATLAPMRAPGSVPSIAAMLWLAACLLPSAAGAQPAAPPPAPAASTPPAAAPPAAAAAAPPAAHATPAPPAEPAEAAEPAEEAVPPPPSYGEASPPPVADTSCVPGCRAGYLCVEGQCVSACNPPCPEGEQCTAAGSCELSAGPPAASGVGWSEGPEAGDPREHNKYMHDGFFLRGTLGFGGTWLAETFDAGTAKLSGGGVLLSLDIGGSLAENLVLHGRLSIASSTADSDASSPSFGDYADTAIGMVLLGPALTYYFMPVNLYLTGVLAFGAGGVVNAEPGASSDDSVSAGGTAFGLDFGWEGWISKQAGMGAALRFQYLSGEHQPEFDFEETTEIRILSFGLVGSFTYQ